MKCFSKLTFRTKLIRTKFSKYMKQIMKQNLQNEIS